MDTDEDGRTQSAAYGAHQAVKRAAVVMAIATLGLAPSCQESSCRYIDTEEDGRTQFGAYSAHQAVK